MSTLTAINKETWLRAIAIDCHVLSTLVIKVSIFETWTTIQPELYVPIGLVSCCLSLHKVVSENVLLYYHFLSRYVTVFFPVLPRTFSVFLCTAHHTVPCTGPLCDTHTHARTLRCSLILVHYVRLLTHKNHHCHIYSTDCLMCYNFRHVRMCPLHLPSTSKGRLT